MNKIILAAVAATVASLGAFAEKKYYTNTSACVDAVISARSISGFDFWTVAPSDLDEADTRIAAAVSTITNMASFYCPLSPKTNRATVPAYASRCPGFAAWVARCGYGSPWIGWNKDAPDDIAGFANAIDGFFWASSTSTPIIGSARTLKMYKDRVISSVQKTIKRTLREKGISFVVKNGRNPVQDRLDALTAALDAPRFAGLKEACAGVGIELVADPAWWIPTDAEIATLKEEIMNGDKAFDDKHKVTLICALGVDAYNKFVKDYNGD